MSDPKRLNKQIIECRQIIAAIEGTGRGWFNHPVVKMYKDHVEWLRLYASTLELFQEYRQTRNFGKKFAASQISYNANDIRPDFITTELCDQHKRRLYTKNPECYSMFEPFGRSEENWYVVDGNIVKYINGRRIL